jgi:hypothetical protein
MGTFWSRDPQGFSADSTLRTIPDFSELNKHIVRKPYPIPKISTMLLEFKGLTYAATIDLNMGYYTIRLDAYASEMCTTIFLRGKHYYKWPPMGFGGSVDALQAQMIDLMASLDYVQAYIDDLLTITRGALDNYLLKIETVLTRLCNARIKVDAAQSFFCTHEIEYLCYILTRDWIRSQPKKVQVILMLKLPNNGKELQHFILPGHVGKA